MKLSVKNILMVVLAGLLVIGIIVILCLYSVRSEATTETETQFSMPATETRIIIREVDKLVTVEKEITAAMLQDGLRDMGVLITQEYYFTEVCDYSSTKTLFNTDLKLGFTNSSYIFSYDGTVTAGIDFAAVTVTKNEDKKRISVVFPASTIQSVTFDYDSFKLYSEKESIWNPISIKDYNLSLVQMKANATQKAISKGVLLRGDERARELISQFIGTLIDMSEYKLEFVTK